MSTHDTTTPVTLRILSGLGPGDLDAARTEPARPAVVLDPRTYARAEDCIQCGLCLPACPTYTTNGLEGDSPRGRIRLMKGLADGRITPSESVRRHLDLCLDCRACETACPSGVVYHELIEETRTRLPAPPARGLTQRVIHLAVLHVFPHPARMRLALLPARLLQRIGLWRTVLRAARVLPAPLEKMLRLIPSPERGGREGSRPDVQAEPITLSSTNPRPRVAMLRGCVSSVLEPELNRRTAALLRHLGCDVFMPSSQGCCGAIHHHAGEEEAARQLARRNIDALLAAEPDYVVSNVAGCGAQLKEYAHLLRDDAGYAERARLFVSRLRDVSQLIVELDPPRPTRRIERVVTYHDACHLAHGQGVVGAPRLLLSWIEGLTALPLAESDTCCGAAGTYNLTQPEMSQALAQRKIEHIRATGASTCVSANIGCTMQIASEARQLGVELRVVHPVELLCEAYGVAARNEE